MSDSGSASNVRSFSGVATPSPKSPIPLDKQKKYDRQLRLWGDHGQSALERARVCLINATATGTETLKNLILPGVSSFTIVDAGRVSGDDAGNNFFLARERLGQSRAASATAALLELNPDVAGDSIEESCSDILRNRPDFFTSFDVVVASMVERSTLLQLAQILWDKAVPLLVCWTNGFLGYIRIAVPEHVMVESHPDDEIPDLRLLAPFPTLVEYCEAQDLSTMSKKDHAHTPWLVLLYHALQTWNATHDGKPPQNYREKKEFKKILEDMNLKNEDGVPETEDNFEEALARVNTTLTPPRIPEEVQTILDDAASKRLRVAGEGKMSSFWILARALREFVAKEGDGKLPLRGTLPDMTADSERYINLQRVYKREAAQHEAALTDHLYALLQQDEVEVHVRERDVHDFCKNAAFLRVLRYRSLESEYTNPASESLATALESDPEGPTAFYPVIRAVQAFREEFNRFPGEFEVEDDIPRLKAHLFKVMTALSLPETLVKEDLVHEVCRYGGSELHSVASYMGGVAAQEVVKLLTNQFVPLDNAFVYSGIDQSTVTLKL